MENTRIVSNVLQEMGKFPATESDESGLKIQVSNNEAVISGSPLDLIELADLLVSLALSGANFGQHWHIDDCTLLDKDSDINELVLTRK